jgi:hypothetical protein
MVGTNAGQIEGREGRKSLSRRMSVSRISVIRNVFESTLSSFTDGVSIAAISVVIASKDPVDHTLQGSDSSCVDRLALTKQEGEGLPLGLPMSRSTTNGAPSEYPAGYTVLTDDILLCKPLQGRTPFCRLVRDLDFYPFVSASGWERNTERRSHDFVLGFQLKLHS